LIIEKKKMTTDWSYKS